MKFRSAHTKLSFNVLPEESVRDTYGRQIQRIPGLRAQFDENRMFDSERAQVINGWTQEQRLHVERSIMSSPRFDAPVVQDMGGDAMDRQLGNISIPFVAFAPGQVLPTEHAEFIKETAAYKSAHFWDASQKAETPTVRCSALIDSADGAIACPRDADTDSQFCLLHEPALTPST